jgi:periplasmic protein TonB
MLPVAEPDAAPLRTTPIPAPVPAALPTDPNPAVESGQLAISCPTRKAPVYLAQAKRLSEQCRMVLRVVLDEAGPVIQAETLTGSDFPRVGAAALSGVKQCQCTPASREGRRPRNVALQPIDVAFGEG